MAMTYQIAAIGDWESVMGFRALGLDTYPVADAAEAREKIRELAKGNCAVIYLTEQLAKDLEDVISRYKDELRPAIILIPGRQGSLGIGRNNIQRAIERAVGADILWSLKRGLRPPFRFPPPVTSVTGAAAQGGWSLGIFLTRMSSGK